MSQPFKLAAFDFDCTIINFNVYEIMKDILDENKPGKEQLKKILETENWIARMNVLFKANSLTETKVKEKLDTIKIDDSMINFLKLLHKNNFEIIIISDNNTFFINYILKKNSLDQYIKKVYANFGEFDKTGNFIVSGLNQEVLGKKEKEVYLKFECNFVPKQCFPNICKQLVLKHHLEKKCPTNSTTHLMYFGDGANDYCPSYVLKSGDYFCVRKGYKLENLITNEELKKNIKAHIMYWIDGADLNNKMREKIDTFK
jgi:2,3-diketo-5-methylthio-1-phosphopentane phosphatase